MTATAPVLARLAALCAALACGCADRQPTRPRPAEPRAAAAFDASAPAAPLDAATTRSPTDAAAPTTLAEGLAALRARGLVEAADEIAARVAQSRPKFRLSESQALACARYLLAERSEPIRALHEVMPRSAVELVRAVHERGVDAAEADRIATFLVDYVRRKRFARLDTFDRNHSHVTGRGFPEIDYSGERMTWQGQEKYWSARGVPDFKTADHIRRYMEQAEALPHFDRVYRPR